MSLSKLIINCETGDKEVVALTADEIAELEALSQAAQAERAAAEAELAAKAEAKASAEAKLSALGLTAEEIAALVK
jgi:predicted DNA-binding transcriptional regulator YafY